MIRDRIQQTSTTSGTGALALDGGAVDGFMAFASVFNDGDRVYYAVIDGNAWEVIEGVFNTGSPPTLSRLRTLASSNGGSPVSFTGNTKQVWNGIPAEAMGATQGRFKAATTSNTDNAYEATLPVAVPALVDHLDFAVRINAGNTGAVTLELNGLPPKPVVKWNGMELVDGDWYPDLIARLHYDAGNDDYLWINAPESAGVKTVSTTTYTVLLADHGRLLRFTHASGCAVTLPEAVAAFAAPFHFDAVAVGGAVTFTPTDCDIDGGASLAVAKDSSLEVRSGGGDYWTRRDVPAAAEPSVAVRQTVLSGPVTTDGLPNFGGSTGSTTVTASGTLVATAANGNDNRVGSILNPSWTGLSTNGTMFLYLDIAADGTCTPGAGTLAPTYRFGGADVTTNGQFTFNIQEMVGKVGNGSVATQTWRVYVGEVTVAGGVVTAIVWYALKGRYVSPFTATLPTTNVRTQFSHNIGTNEIYGTKELEIECTTTEQNFSVGDRVKTHYGTGAATAAAIQVTHTRLVAEFTTSTGAAFYVTNKTASTQAVITAANWKYRLHINRGW